MVRPALEQFYQSLTDEQKERFNAIARTPRPRRRRSKRCAAVAGRGMSCFQPSKLSVACT